MNHAINSVALRLHGTKTSTAPGGGAIIAAPESKTRLFGLQKESPPAQVTKVRNDVPN
jgi:predicted amidohydrolase YtcJ